MTEHVEDMMDEIEFPTTVTKHWRITIPPEARKLLSLRKGEVVVVKIKKTGKLGEGKLRRSRSKKEHSEEVL